AGVSLLQLRRRDADRVTNMANRIQRILVMDMRLDPAEAEVWFSVYPAALTTTTQVHGRLMGPACAYSTTVEVAYPLREHKREYEQEGRPHLNHRVIIPEPNFWDPVSPFLYRAVLELWQDKQVCDRSQLTHGLRTLRLGPGGLLWNDRPLRLRGR